MYPCYGGGFPITFDFIFCLLLCFFRNVLPEPVDFSFDLSLVEESSGRLQANQLAVDNLTIEWVKNKLSALETKHKECLDNLASNKTNGNKDSR